MKTANGVYFNITEEPLETKHVCYTIGRQSEINKEVLLLIEVVEETYRHPEAPDYALITRYNTKVVDEANANSFKAAGWVVLEASEKSVDYQRDKT